MNQSRKILEAAVAELRSVTGPLTRRAWAASNTRELTGSQVAIMAGPEASGLLATADLART